jgi:nucleoside-diphosphate-sugar epimerase
MPGRVLVTGAQGFLGRELVAAFLAGGAEAVLGIGRSERDDAHFTHRLDWCGTPLPAPAPDRLRPDARYEYAVLDATDQAAVTEAVGRFRPEVIVHAAASLRDEGFDSLLASNLRTTYELASACADARLVHVSSGSVYGAARGELPLREDGPLEPVELYGVSKRAAEDVARTIAADVVVARVFNLVGAGLQDRHLPARLAAELAATSRGLRPATLSLAPLEATRDFIDVRDAAAAIVLCADPATPAGAYNVASGVETPVRAILDTLLELSGLDAEITWREGRARDIPRAFADVSRLSRLGFRPAHSLGQTLADMYAYFDTFPAP